MAATSLKKSSVSTTVDLGVWWSTLPLWLDWSMDSTVRGGENISYYCDLIFHLFSLSYQISKHGVVDATRSFGHIKVIRKTGIKVQNISKIIIQRLFGLFLNDYDYTCYLLQYFRNHIIDVNLEIVTEQYFIL